MHQPLAGLHELAQAFTEAHLDLRQRDIHPDYDCRHAPGRMPPYSSRAKIGRSSIGLERVGILLCPLLSLGRSTSCPSRCPQSPGPKRYAARFSTGHTELVDWIAKGGL